MIDPQRISIEDYTYQLPDDRIARYPLEQRDSSKLLIYKNGQIQESIYADIADHVPKNSLLIFNNTKVVEARLLFEKPNGSIIEIFFLEPDDVYKDITGAMLTTKSIVCKCLVGGAKKWKEPILEKKINAGERNIILYARRVNKIGNYFLIEFSWQPAEMSFAELLHIAGVMPLPPYLNRNAEDNDATSYQTIYAMKEGSVAAPTAGLHFTNDIFTALAQKHIETSFVTLHVGAGTFMPVKAKTMQGHDMHAEYIHVQKSTIELLLQYAAKTKIAVGTTSLRTLESLYWMGVKVYNNKDLNADDLFISQWEPYEMQSAEISLKESLHALLLWMQMNATNDIIARTQILIVPGYRLKVANAIITNFHQPKSTLLLLVAAIAGKNWKSIYEYALNKNFRFLSYGDGCLIWNDNMV